MTNPEIAQRQAEIDARLAAATPGEWVATDGFVFTSFVQETNRGSLPLFAQGRVVLTAGNADAEFCANAKLDLEWQRERIKALEAENTHLTEWVNATLSAQFASSKQRMIQNKWARRWKQEAKRQSARRESLANHARELVSVGESKTHVTEMESLSARRWARMWKRKVQEVEVSLHLIIKEKTARIATLENAARSCATCVYCELDHELRLACRIYETTDPEPGCWVFDEARFTPKEETANGKS